VAAIAGGFDTQTLIHTRPCMLACADTSGVHTNTPGCVETDQLLLIFVFVDLALQGNTMPLADPVDVVHDAHFPQNESVDAELAEDVAGMQQQQNSSNKR
jgi:hypothetical protein